MDHPLNPNPTKTLQEILDYYKSIGEHAIIVLFTATSNAAIPICWCHTEAEAIATRDRLLDAAAAVGKKPFIWFIPVSDAPRMPD